MGAPRIVRAALRRLVDIRSLVWLGHYALIPIIISAVMIRVAAVAWGWLGYLVMLPPLTLLIVAVLAHGSGICPRGKCAVIMNTNPSAEATRRAWWLHHAHHQFTSKITLAILGVWFVLTFVTVNTIMSSVPVIALIVLELRAIQIHSRLRPWCPECFGGGPDDQQPPTPPPPGGHGRAVPRDEAPLEVLKVRQPPVASAGGDRRAH